MNQNREVRNEDRVHPWWTKHYRMVHESFEVEEPVGWRLSRGARIAGHRGLRFLNTTAPDAAIWEVSPLAQTRLDFRGRSVRGVGMLCLCQSEEEGAGRSVLLRIEPERVLLVHRQRGEVRELDQAPIDIAEDRWRRWTVWLQPDRILVELDGRLLLDVEPPEPLPAGPFAFGAEKEGAFDYAEMRLLSGKAGLMWIEGKDLSSLLDAPGKLLDPETYPGPLSKLTFVPFEILPFLGIKQPSPINAGTVPPTFVHSWGIDIQGFASFRLAFRPGHLGLDWASGDRIRVVDSHGQTLTVFSSFNDVANQSVTVQATAFDSGRPHIRCYLILETSSLEIPRRFKLHGVYVVGAGTGKEEALLVGDDLNYNPTLGAFFRTPGGGEPEQPWRPRGANTNPFAPLLPEPKADDGWYLVGKNTTEPEAGFYSLIYYNERTSNLRAYLYNDSLETAVSGYSVEFRLRARNTMAFEDLKGAFFGLDPRPYQWWQATVTIPIWPHQTWAFAEVPMFYPMASHLPDGQPKPATNIPKHYYRSVYEDQLTESLRNVVLLVSVTPYFKGAVKADVVGEAIGHAIQQLNSGPVDALGALKGIFAAVKEGKDYYSKGSDFHKAIKDYYEKQKGAGVTGPDMQQLAGLVALGAGAWGGAFAAVGAGIAIYENFFKDPEPLQLAIELSIRAKMTGSVFSPYQPRYHEVYLPGRFSIQDAFFSDLQSKQPGRIEAAIARYDRTLGHLGFRYDPTTIEIRMLRVDSEQSEPDYDEGIFEEYPTQWQWVAHFYFPSVKNPKPPYPLYPGGKIGVWHSEKYVHPYTQIDRWLPVLYNPYAEIIPMAPTVIGRTSKPRPIEHSHDQWFWWTQDISWKTHVSPESDDAAFPVGEDTGQGPSLSLKVFNGNAANSAAQNDQWAHSGPLPEGVWLDIEPLPSYVPSTYRQFKEITDLHTHTYGCAHYFKADPLFNNPNAPVRDFRELKKKHYRPFDPDDPFPVVDVIFCWDVAYFYYGRSRKANGTVPSCMQVPRLQSPVTLDVTRHILNFYSDEFVKETHSHVKSKSRMAVKA